MKRESSSLLFTFPHLSYFFPSPLFSRSGHEHFVKYTRDVSRAHSNSSSSDVNESTSNLLLPPRLSWKTPRHQHFITLLQSPAGVAAASGTSLKIRLKIGPRVDACHQRGRCISRCVKLTPAHGFMLIQRGGVRVNESVATIFT